MVPFTDWSDVRHSQLDIAHVFTMGMAMFAKAQALHSPGIPMLYSSVMRDPATGSC